MTKVFFETLGCAKNEVDTRTMADRLREAGFIITDQLEDSDIAIVNTCSFIRSATEESIDTVLDIADQGSSSESRRPLIVSGCMASRYGGELEEALTEADAFVACDQEENIVSVVTRVLGVASPDPDGISAPPDLPWAYLKISDGCNRCCSFCTIPRIRGSYHSFPFEEILAEARVLESRGARELVLIGQDTGIWGKDLEGSFDTAWLLERLSDELPDLRLRLMYTEPDGVTDHLLHVMATRGNICDYLDIPLQHVVPHILKDMRRGGSSEHFVHLVNHIRQIVPEIALRTTLMCGFPGESDEDFEELLSFVSLGLFDYIGIFAYSPEEGTYACNLPDQIPEDVKQMRAAELRSLADSVCAPLIAERINTTQSVLIEGVEEDAQLFGRAACQGPEVDGITFLDRGRVGDVCSVRIDDTLLYDMEGEVL